MRIAVAGATGPGGSRTVARPRDRGVKDVPVSRADGAGLATDGATPLPARVGAAGRERAHVTEPVPQPMAARGRIGEAHADVRSPFLGARPAEKALPSGDGIRAAAPSRHGPPPSAPSRTAAPPRRRRGLTSARQEDRHE